LRSGGYLNNTAFWCPEFVSHFVGRYITDFWGEAATLRFFFLKIVPLRVTLSLELKGYFTVCYSSANI